MARRNDPLRRFPSRPIDTLGRETIQSVAWDMSSVWPTSSEWLAWVKRRDGRKTRWDGKRWGYPVRPMVAKPLRKLP